MSSPPRAAEDDQGRSRRQLGPPPGNDLLEKAPATKEARPVKMTEAQLPTAFVLQRPLRDVAAINMLNDEAKLQWAYFTLDSLSGLRPAELNAVTLSNLRDTINAVVQEELRKVFPNSGPQVATLGDVVREEVQQALGTRPIVPPSQELEWAPRGPRMMPYPTGAPRPTDLRATATPTTKQLPTTCQITRSVSTTTNLPSFTVIIAFASPLPFTTPCQHRRTTGRLLVLTWQTEDGNQWTCGCCPAHPEDSPGPKILVEQHFLQRVREISDIFAPSSPEAATAHHDKPATPW
ncbi:hypothetical protein HPB52_002518 [Rhipicephalus sanguineus]|uniref:Uncharacterized protein n=1 Tax=Rhipicephalus sanguineus TaxID=34632 RepID=A0A9D4PA12_RHISA|nr:hypothetical protein HPB52_002518 [Rhipicephalus sanguineus]